MRRRGNSRDGPWRTADGCPTEDYNADQLEFMRALDKYKRDKGRPFPTSSEVLEVLKGLGYRKEKGEQ